MSGAPARPQLVASDLDGTLLPPDGVFPPGLAEGVAALRGAGVAFVVSTGRMVRSARAVVSRIGLQDGPIVCYQGAVVADLADGRALTHTPVPGELAADVVRTAHGFGRQICVFIDDSFITDRDTDRSRYYARYSGVERHLLPDLQAAVLQNAPTKLLIMTTPEDVERLLPVFRERYDGRLYVVRSQPEYLEFMSASVSKSAALAHVCGLLGVDPARTVACGDADNDLDMLDWSGLSVAVAEGNAAVRAAADVVVPRAGLGDLFQRLAEGRPPHEAGRRPG